MMAKKLCDPLRCFIFPFCISFLLQGCCNPSGGTIDLSGSILEWMTFDGSQVLFKNENGDTSTFTYSERVYSYQCESDDMNGPCSGHTEACAVKFYDVQ